MAQEANELYLKNLGEFVLQSCPLHDGTEIGSRTSALAPRQQRTPSRACDRKTAEKRIHTPDEPSRPRQA